jgi:hypothetical protein
MELVEGETRKAIIARYKRASPEQVQKLYEHWDGNGGKYTKKDIEVRFFGDFRSNGKRYTRLVWDHLRIDIEEKSVLMRRCEALEERVTTLEGQVQGFVDLARQNGWL